MTWFTILGMALITFISRFAFFSKGLRYKPSKKMVRFLSFSSYSILTAIWVPVVLQFDIENGLNHSGNDYLIAAAVAIILAVMKVHNLVVVLVSSGLFFLLRAFVFSVA